LGNAEAKAKGWLGQREQIAKSLAGILDTASSLLQRLAAVVPQWLSPFVVVSVAGRQVPK
jgi:hypothetical protein